MTEQVLAGVLCSSAAALMSRLCTHPLDTLKTRIQSDQGTSRRSLWGTCIGIWKSEGPFAFYRGLPIAMIFSVPALSSYLWAYDTSKALLSASGTLGTKHSALVHAASACMAEAVSGIFWTPMEVIKNKQQQPGKSLRTLVLVKDVYSSKGFRGLFRGYFLGLMVFMPQTVCLSSLSLESRIIRLIWTCKDR